MRNDTCKQDISGSSVADVVFAFTRCFHRHLDLCGMFDRPLCRKVVATYVLRRKGKMTFRCNVESTSLTTSVICAWLSDVATQSSSSHQAVNPR